MTQYTLYRDLARAIYALALDANQSRDSGRVATVDAIARSAFKPLREELGGDTPIFEILEYLDPPSVQDDDWWSFSMDRLKELKSTYPEVLGDNGGGVKRH